MPTLKVPCPHSDRWCTNRSVPTLKVPCPHSDRWHTVTQIIAWSGRMIQLLQATPRVSRGKFIHVAKYLQSIQFQKEEKQKWSIISISCLMDGVCLNYIKDDQQQQQQQQIKPKMHLWFWSRPHSQAVEVRNTSWLLFSPCILRPTLSSYSCHLKK